MNSFLNLNPTAYSVNPSLFKPFDKTKSNNLFNKDP